MKYLEGFGFFSLLIRLIPPKQSSYRLGSVKDIHWEF